MKTNLSALMFDAREGLSMYADHLDKAGARVSVGGFSGPASGSVRELIEWIDEYRVARGWDVDGFSEKDMETVPPAVEKRFTELSLLKDGWLDGHGRAVSADCIDAAREAVRAFLADPVLFPTPQGGVEVQWGQTEAALTFNPGGVEAFIDNELLVQSEDSLPAETRGLLKSLGVDIDRFEEGDLSDCPAYFGDGTCRRGCREEPRCRTEEPEGEWPLARVRAALRLYERVQSLPMEEQLVLARRLGALDAE